MTDHPSKSLRLDGAKLIFRNFQGLERQYNTEGDRNFSIVLDPLRAKELIAEGWRVKQLKPRGEDEEGDFHLKVKVNYRKGRPPRVVVINPVEKTRVEWGEDEVGLLDAVDLENVDVLLNGWYSDMAGGGYSAFLQSIYVTLHVDELEAKYAGLLEPNPEMRSELVPDDTEEG